MTALTKTYAFSMDGKTKMRKWMPGPEWKRQWQQLGAVSFANVHTHMFLWWLEFLMPLINLTTAIITVNARAILNNHSVVTDALRHSVWFESGVARMDAWIYEQLSIARFLSPHFFLVLLLLLLLVLSVSRRHYITQTMRVFCATYAVGSAIMAHNICYKFTNIDV